MIFTVHLKYRPVTIFVAVTIVPGRCRNTDRDRDRNRSLLSTIQVQLYKLLFIDIQSFSVVMVTETITETV
jgi:hypothetical protein